LCEWLIEARRHPCALENIARSSVERGGGRGETLIAVD
jgi:hypothetical protein